MFIKKKLKRILTRSVLFPRLMLFLTRKQPRILMYHRFGNRPGMVSAENFNWQVRLLKPLFDLASMKQHFQTGNFIQNGKPKCVITIDDGYSDFYQYAYPLLKVNKVPATFFVTTGFINQDMWFWFDKLRYILSNSSIETGWFDYKGEELRLNLHPKNRYLAHWSDIADYCFTLDDREKASFIGQLSRHLQVSIPKASPLNFQACSWGQLKEMYQNGIELGSHTVTHSRLTDISSAQLDAELSKSKKEIESKVNGEVTTFAYPYGLEGDYSDHVKKRVAAANYRCATVAHNNIRIPQDEYTIRRLGISNHKVDFLWKVYGFENYFQKHSNGF